MKLDDAIKSILLSIKQKSSKIKSNKVNGDARLFESPLSLIVPVDATRLDDIGLNNMNILYEGKLEHKY